MRAPTLAVRSVLTADNLKVFATYLRHSCMLKGVLFSLFTYAPGLISGPTRMSFQTDIRGPGVLLHQQCSDTGVCIESSFELLPWQ